MAIEHKPSRNEEEYFARVDADLRKEMRAKADAERAAQVAADRNKCPRDGTPLVSREIHHVVIDTCPTCEGTWLDKGELEILEKAHDEYAGFVTNVLNMFK